MKELGEALKLIFDKIAGFFDIFDLSFFVSGALALGAVLFWLGSNGFHEPQLDGWLEVLALIIGSYINGLVCFSIGRFVRVNWIMPKTNRRRIPKRY